MNAAFGSVTLSRLTASRQQGFAVGKPPFADQSKNTGHSFRSMLKLSMVFALIKLVLHVGSNLLQSHLGWGYFSDEAYYILCGERLDWGYVDHGPIVALQARLAILLFGKSLTGVRMLASLAGAAKLMLTGILAWQLGAGRRGQFMALSAVLLSPQFLLVDGFLSMNAFEPVFWMTAVIAILQIVKTGPPTNGKAGSYRWWVLLGMAAGIGCENKPSMVFFLVAMLMGLLVTRERRSLRSRGFLVAIALTFVLACPYLIWQWTHHWATYQFLHNQVAYLHTSIRMFLPQQVLTVWVVGVPMIGAGLWWLLRARSAVRFRFLGWTYLFFLFIMMALRSKNYYITPVYPMLFAAGAAAFEGYMAAHKRSWLVPVCLIQMFAVEIPYVALILPLVSPDQWHRVTILQNMGRPAQRLAHFNQLYALRFGWQPLADDVTAIYAKLPPAERAKAGIICPDYHTASAINFLSEGRGLPFAISGHNNYFLWGPHGETGAVMIVVSHETREALLAEYDQVEQVGSMHDPYAIPWHANIYLCHNRKRPFGEDWPTLKHYD